MKKVYAVALMYEGQFVDWQDTFDTLQKAKDYCKDYNATHDVYECIVAAGDYKQAE